MVKRAHFLLIGVLLFPFTLPRVYADPVTVTFTVFPAPGDPVNMRPSTGFFTFDSSLLPSGEALLSHPSGLGTSVSFLWGDTFFDISNANVGELRFDESGRLIHWVLGAYNEEWSGLDRGIFSWVASPAGRVIDDFVISPDSFFYTLRGREGTFSNVPAPVPEPSTMLLLASGMAMMYRAAGRRRRIDRPVP